MTVVSLTEAARDLVARIQADQGAVVLVQNTGCVCGDAPQCFPLASFRPSTTDYAIPTGIEGLTLWRSRKLDANGPPDTILIDAENGRRGGFALENLFDRLFRIG